MEWVILWFLCGFLALLIVWSDLDDGDTVSVIEIVMVVIAGVVSLMILLVVWMSDTTITKGK